FTITNDGTETGSGTISLDNTNDFIADLPLPYDFILQPDESLEISVTFISLMPSGEKTGELLVDGDAPANNVSASLQGYTLSAGGDWSAELTITGETGSAPNIFNVTIGAMEESSFIPAPPPPPQYLTWPGLYDINWGGPYFELIYEFVYDTLTWILEIDPNGNVMPPISRTSVVSWDNAGLPASGELYIEDYFTGSVIVPDMRTATNFSLTGTENKYFNIINIPGAPPVFPEIELSAEELDFGSVAVGNDADLPLTIYSVGDTTLQIISVISNDPAFTVDFTPIGIEPGDSLVLIVSFSPPDTAVYESILSIINNAQTQEVDLYGEGYSGLFVGVTPVNPPIIIPASGGTFEFILSGDNATGQAQTVDIWTEVALPQVGTVGPLLLVENFTLSPFQSVSRNRFQAVPASAPGGTYTYYAYLGEYPWVIDIYDTFIFIKAGSDGGDYLGSVEDWRCSGEDFDMISAVVEIPSETALHSPYPNPFNPSTIISFELRDASEVSLIVYDIQGREVQSLVTGHLSLGYHEAVWNAEDFASGIYFVRLQAGDFMQTRKLLLIK
ncbi:T9SS type A sorting domain-containing protein, partial [bacterium]|nr:T9SS type A sorting domain-containing protein [bacterium]